VRVTRERDVGAMLLAVGLPMLMMLLFAVAPIAVPVLAFLWIARVLSGPSRRQLPRGYGGWSGWEVDKRSRARGRRPARWP
jgi:hypothetical protein